MLSSATRRVAFGLMCGMAPAVWALPSLYHLTDLGPDSEAQHINKTGIASGTDRRSGGFAPALWIDGNVSDLPSLDGQGAANWVNASGVASGNVDTDTGIHAAIWSSAGVLTDVGAVVGVNESYAAAINDNGDCTIVAAQADGLHSYLSAGCTGSGMLDIGSLGGGDTSSLAITENGQIAGMSHTAPGKLRAFLYRRGHMKNLGVLPHYDDSGAVGMQP